MYRITNTFASTAALRPFAGKLEAFVVPVCSTEAQSIATWNPLECRWISQNFS
jgi:hypothetical protein